MKMQAHVSDIGWQDKENNGKIIGTTGKNKGIEAYSLSIQKENLGITYTSCINGKWQADVSDGQMSGTIGQAKHIEAIKNSTDRTGKRELSCIITGYMYRISAGLTGQQMEHRQEQSITNTQSKLFRWK